MPHIQSLSEIYKEDKVMILGINSWERDNDKVKPFLSEHNITYRILLDSNDQVIGKYGVQGIPTFFIIDKKGVIRYAYTGMPPERQVIQQNVEVLLAE
jgi:peroxiredoxin